MSRLIMLIAVLTLTVACSPSEAPATDSSVDAPTISEDTEQSAERITVTEQNYANAETARNFWNWVKLGADKQVANIAVTSFVGHGNRGLAILAFHGHVPTLDRAHFIDIQAFAQRVPDRAFGLGIKGRIVLQGFHRRIELEVLVVHRKNLE